MKRVGKEAEVGRSLSEKGGRAKERRERGGVEGRTEERKKR